MILIVSVLIIAYFCFKMYSGSNVKEAKTAQMKKEEITKKYECQMRELLDDNKDDLDTLPLKKTELLKQISRELSTNIFFDKLEVKDIILKLANMH